MRGQGMGMKRWGMGDRAAKSQYPDCEGAGPGQWEVLAAAGKSV